MINGTILINNNNNYDIRGNSKFDESRNSFELRGGLSKVINMYFFI